MTTQWVSLPGRRQQGGAIAILMAISLAAILAMVGLAIDSGRLYINKTELQTAADSCALAAARELVCDPSAGTCPASYLSNAEKAGLLAASRNKSGLQSNAVTIAPSDIRFSTTLSPNSGYSSSGTASPNSRFVMCVARASGIVPWFGSLISATNRNVVANAVASLKPSQNFCVSTPLAVCAKSGATAPDFGYTPKQWITMPIGGASTGSDFRWASLTGSAVNATEIRTQLGSATPACNFTPNTSLPISNGSMTGVNNAYNTRFGIYPNGAGLGLAKETSPPDKTGFSFPNSVNSINSDVYPAYIANQGTNTSFNGKTSAIPYSDTGNITSGSSVLSPADYKSYGSERRLTPILMMDCSNPASGKILGAACVLALNPMGSGSDNLYFEYLGNAKNAGSPCGSTGIPGGSSSTGPLVPSLVQ